MLKNYLPPKMTIYNLEGQNLVTTSGDEPLETVGFDTDIWGDLGGMY